MAVFTLSLMLGFGLRLGLRLKIRIMSRVRFIFIYRNFSLVFWLCSRRAPISAVARTTMRYIHNCRRQQFKTRHIQDMIHDKARQTAKLTLQLKPVS
jgi:hypothetical protein